MHSITSIEGLLFRLYLSNCSQGLLRRLIHTRLDDFDTPEFYKAAFASSQMDYVKRVEAARKKTEDTLAQLEKEGIRILPHFDKEYPQNLLQIKDYPPLLFVKGALLKMECAAVIGSRNVAEIAEGRTTEIVRQIVAHNFGIVSGLALGIDTLAHEAALKYGGYTAAVLPTAINVIYPPTNRKLAELMIGKGGAFGTAARRPTGF